MRIRSLLVLVALSTAILVPLVSSQAANPFGAGWKPLFNGKDLSGWKKVGNEKWVVEDGAIFGAGITNEYGYLATEKSYKDFHMSLRYKCEAAGNSGVYFHTAFKPDTVTVTEGRQVEIDRSIGHHSGGVYGDNKGWIVWPAAELETVIDPDGWNDMLIKVEGRRYVVFINGVQMIDFTNPSPGATEGVIALQLHSGGEGRMRFKDLWIRDLSK